MLDQGFIIEEPLLDIWIEKKLSIAVRTKAGLQKLNCSPVFVKLQLRKRSASELAS